jgi:methanethiol S-methyltransferase
VIFGQLVHWPTIPTLLLAPLIAWFYVRLAKREEGDLIEQFGVQYEQYREVVPRFIPGWQDPHAMFSWARCDIK